MNLETIKGRIVKPQRVVIYGPEGIGKSTLASQFPRPVFVDTEGSTEQLDVVRFPRPQDWAEFAGFLRQAAEGDHEFRTLVVDTVDWAERLCTQFVCARARKAGIEDFGYGKGYTYLAEEFGHMLTTLTRLRERGMHVVLVAHSQIRKFEQPDEMGAYDRYELKCSRQVSPLLKEWADMLLFCQYKTVVVEGTDGSRRKAVGGRERRLYTSHTAAWDAKNRHGLRDELPFEYRAIASAFEPAGATSAPSRDAAPTAGHINNAAQVVAERR